MIYPAHFQSEAEGGYTVTFRDMPGVTYGESMDEALEQAEACLITALSHYADNGEEFPQASSPKPGERLIFVPTLFQAKLVLIKRMAEAQVSNVELAKRLECSEAAVRRLVSLNHQSQMRKIDAALAKLDARLTVVAS